MTARPPLNALHTFCSVVRSGGFRQAAHALCVTPGAVSRQILVLEGHMGQLLFNRGARATLTPAGQRLHERVADKMEAICAALERSNAAGRGSTILVDTNVTFAMHWLIPHLRFFAERHPRVKVQVRTSDGAVDPTTPVDVFIRRDVGELRGLPAQVFMTERSVLVSSPSSATGRTLRTSNRMQWLARLPRVGARSRPDLWPRWNDFHGLHGPTFEPTVEFDNTVLAIQAVAQGLGACVVPEVFVQDMLDSGTLRLLHASRVDTGSYAYAVGRRRDSARVGRFTEWLSGMQSAHRSVA
jgi:LysR family glycine cleavage system transcriptional activator